MVAYRLTTLRRALKTLSENLGLGDAINWKNTGSRPNEDNESFAIYLILPATLGPGVYSASNRVEYQKQKKYFWGVERGRHVNLTTTCELIVQTMWDSQHLTILYVSTACYGDSFTCLPYY
jgi:hypothetical protein